MKFLFITRKQLHSFIYCLAIICIFTAICFVLLDNFFIFASADEDVSDFLFEKTLDNTTLNSIHNLMKNKEKIAYLTFDDGPNKKVTPKVLDILEKQEVKANFFVVGKHVEELPQLVKREYESGHYIANHGYSHNNKNLYQSKKSFLTEVVKTDEAIAKAIGVSGYRSHIFRFPNGSMGKNIMPLNKIALTIYRKLIILMLIGMP